MVHKAFKQKRKRFENLREGWHTQAVAVTKASVQESLDKLFGLGGDVKSSFGTIAGLDKKKKMR